MKFALVGVGKWGQKYLKILKDIKGAELVATCSKSYTNYYPLSNELKFAPHFTSLSKMLETIQCDTVILATHPESHFPLAMQALKLGKHVICEKPFMLSDEEIIKLEWQAILSDKKFFTSYINLFHNIINQIELLACDNSIKLTLTNVGNGPVRDGYSDVWDYGSHVFSVIHSLDDSLVRIEDYKQDKFGNHVVSVATNYGEVEAIFGNKSPDRKHIFDASNGIYSISWTNNHTENPLRTMIERFARHQLNTNITFSRRIKDSLLKVEAMNKNFVKRS